MMRGNNALEEYKDPIQVLKHVCMSIEPNFREVTRNFERFFSVNKTNLERVTAGLHERKTGGAIFGKSMISERDGRAKGESPIFIGICQEKFMDTNLVKGVQSYGVSLTIKERCGSDNSGKEDLSIIAHLEPLVISIAKMKESEVKGRRKFKLEDFFEVAVDQLKNFPKFDVGFPEFEFKSSASKPPLNHHCVLKALAGILKGKRADISDFLLNMNFARVGGVPSSMVEVSGKDMENEELGVAINKEDISEPHNLATGLLSTPLSQVERLRSTLSTASFTELIELLSQIGDPVMEDHPDKKILFVVHNFFRYTEAEGRKFFHELDRNGDGQVTLEDLEIAMRLRKLPQRYAHEFMRHAREHFFSKSFGWKQFLSLMDQKEQTILQAYTNLCLSKSGTLQKNEILATLKNSGLPANEDNAVAMMRILNADVEESISYGHFRNFMLLLPSDKLCEDPR